MRLTERFRRRDFGHLELSMTIDDPRAFKKAWTTGTVMSLLPDTELIEAFCDGHEKTMEHRRIARRRRSRPARHRADAPRLLRIITPVFIRNSLVWVVLATSIPRAADGCGGQVCAAATNTSEL